MKYKPYPNSYKPSSMIQIKCPNSCQPSYTKEDTEYFDNCWIEVKRSENRLYSASTLRTGGCSCDVPTSWFNFRIVTPKTSTYWKKIEQRENCHSTEPIPASTTIRESIVQTSSSTNTSEIEFQIKAGIALETLSASLNVDFRKSYSWQSTSIYEMSQSREHVIGGAGGETYKIKPGYKWIVYQWIGEAAYFRLATATFKTCDVPCETDTDTAIEEYCNSA